MQIGGKEYKVGQRIRIINAKSVLHYRYGMAGDCNEDMTGITGTITAAVDHSLPHYVHWMLRQVRKSGEQNPERNITHYTFTKSEKGAVVNMQQAVFTAHCPYELGDIVEVAIIEGMAITGYPRRLGTAEMQITDIITEHSLKNGTVSFIYELDGKKRMQLIPWNELTKRSKKH